MNKLVLIAIVTFALSHPTIHDNWPRNEECIQDKPPRIYSYHFHVVFDNKTKDLADKLKLEFAHFLNVDLNDPQFKCNELFFLENQPLCFFPTDYNPGRGSPFMNPQWAILFLPHDFHRIVSWGMQNRGDLDIIIHPNTGCEIADHTWYVIYGGNPRALDISIYKREEKPFPDEVFRKQEELLQDKNLSERVKNFISNH